MTSATSCDSMYDLFNPVNNEKKENNMSPNEQKSSQTALFSALRRAIANEIYQNSLYAPDDLAEVFLP